MVCFFFIFFLFRAWDIRGFASDVLLAVHLIEADLALGS